MYLYVVCSFFFCVEVLRYLLKLFIENYLLYWFCFFFLRKIDIEHFLSTREFD